MKRLLFVAILVASCFSLSAQNLVPNSSFESIGSPPCSWITSSTGFNNAINNWTMPSNGSTDIFSTYVGTTCYAHPFSTHASSPGNQAPRSGNVMSALLTYGDGCGWQPNYREYLQAELTSPMVTGQSYDVQFYVSLGDACASGTNNLGAHFRTTSYYQATCFVLPLTPQFNHTGVITNKTGWTLVSGTVTATANWRYMILGNFYSNAATTRQSAGGSNPSTRYFIDDVSLSPAVILPSEDVLLSAQRQRNGVVDLQWVLPKFEHDPHLILQRSGDGNMWVDIVRPEATATGFGDEFPPQGNLFYRLRYTDLDGTQFHSPIVRIQAGNDFPYLVRTAPNPAAPGQDIWLRVGQADDTPATLSLHDLSGKEVWSLSGKTVRELDGLNLNQDELAPGFYLIRINTPRGVFSQKLLVGGKE